MSNELQRVDKGFWGALKSLSMGNVDRANAINRNITEYHPCEIDAFFDPALGVYNAIISGGDIQNRAKAVVSQVLCSVRNNFPVIVLHEGNRYLEQQIKNNLSGTRKYREISPNCPSFEPFYDLSILEISEQIIETAPKTYKLDYNARYYIEALGKYLEKKKLNPSFRMISNCPHHQMFDKVDDLYQQGKITDREANEIKTKLMMGQSENYKLDSLLTSMRLDSKPILYQSQNSNNYPVNIWSAIWNRQVLCFDVVSMSNKTLINTIVYQLQLAQARGMNYSIIIDSLSINSNEAFEGYIKSPSDRNFRMFSSDDFYAMVGGDEKVFSSAIGNTQILIIMGHASGNTASKWADVFGQYDKLEQSITTSRGSSKATPFSIFSSPNRSQAVNISKNREHVVKPEAITRMGPNEAYILTAARGELAHLRLL